MFPRGPFGCASDPAPQQLTAPCRKYSGRLHHSIEQPVYRLRLHDLSGLCCNASGLHRRRRYGSVHTITNLIGVMILAAATAAAQVPASSTIKGVVVDARTGSPLPQVLVAVEAGPSVMTSQNGTFVLEGLAAGRVRLSVSMVGYGLVQRVLDLQPEAVAELRIPLSEGAAAYSESVTVTADRFQRPDLVPAQQILGSAELQNLRGVLTDDALREAATLRSTSSDGCVVTNPAPYVPTWQTVIDFLNRHVRG